MDLTTVALNPTTTYHKQTYLRLDPTKTTFEAKGKAILVTAGSTGIGFEISQAFAQAGVKRIIVVSRRTEPQEKAKKTLEPEFPGLEVQCIQASVTDYPKMTSLFRSAGDIDVLVLSHTAAHDMTSPSKDLVPEELQPCLDTNVIAPMHLVQQYLHLPMPAAGGTKTVVHISTAAAQVALPGQIGHRPSTMAFSRMLGDLSCCGAWTTGEGRGEAVLVSLRGVLYGGGGEGEDIKLPAHFAVWLASPEADFLHGSFVWAHWDVDDLIATVRARLAKEPGFLKFGLFV